ncbi:MAG: 5-formyltetrahydrofolate cyclo-ligase [Planctomycetes bacterium]|nr:5-formyltetrahydrofolate cyclo-ligase [Planctomycetota bacterium]
MDKKQLRQELQKCLREIEPEKQAQKSRRACERLISTAQFQDASVIMMYLAIPNEADCCDAIAAAWQQGKTVIVPKVCWEDKEMTVVQIDSLEADFSTEVSGLRNPIDGVPVPFGQIDLVVTPALAYDRRGNRLGRGGAYYDRFFASDELKASRCGFAFSEQLVESVPVENHDQMVHFLVTDSEVITFDNQQGE